MDHIIHQLVSDTINVVMITFYIRNEEKNLGISLDEKNSKLIDLISIDVMISILLNMYNRLY